MKIIECKQVEHWNGGDRYNFAYYVSDTVSDKDIKARDGHHTYIGKKTFVIFDSLEEVDDHDVHKLRKQVWAKLSPLERQAIDMEDPN